VKLARPVLLPALLLFSIGCGSDLGPGSGTTRYFELASVDGRQLPAVYDSTASQWQVVETDTLVLDGASDGATEIYHGWQMGAGGFPQTYSYSSIYKYAVHGESIELTQPSSCGPTCPDKRGGHIDDSSVSLDTDNDVSPNSVWVYRRVSGPQ
jgi:hypothetical protein